MKIGISGVNGRMGQALLSSLSRSPTKCSLAAVGTSRDPASAQALLTQYGVSSAVALTTSCSALVSNCDAVIDFTTPENSVAIARACAEAGIIHIIGTTGFTEPQQREIAAAAARARIVQSANFSLGVNVLASLVARTASLLDAEYDIEIDEMHHALKKDAPSGTALLLARAAAEGREIDLADAQRHYGEGIIGAREKGTIGLSVRRGGEVVGVHTVTFAGPGETLELTHRASSRSIYAHGAVKAALWAENQKPGLYSMRDVLGI